MRYQLIKPFDFIKSGRIFTVFGIFLPGFTIIIILAFQSLLMEIGMQCESTWKAIFVTAFIAGLLIPFLFLRYLKFNYTENSKLKTAYIIFNTLEYLMLQCALASFMTNGNTLCNVVDGQNGLEFAFTGWGALPFLFAFAFRCDYLQKKYLESNIRLTRRNKGET